VDLNDGMKEITPGTQRLRFSDAGDAEYPYASAPEEVHLRDYLKILVKRRRLVLAMFAIVVVAGAYFTFTATPLYVAVATLKIEPQNVSVSGLPEMFQSAVTGYDYYQTQFALLESRPVAAKVISELNLKSDPVFTDMRIVSSDAIGRLRSTMLGYFGRAVTSVAELFRGSKNGKNSGAREEATIPVSSLDASVTVVPSGLVSKYLRLLKVKPVPRTRLVELVFSAPEPRLAQKLANAHADAFINMSLETRTNLTNESREFLAKKLTELRSEVERAEAKLHRFRTKHKVVSLDKGENIVIDQLMDINKRLTDAKTARIEAESLQMVVADKKYQDLSAIMKLGLVSQLRSNVAKLEEEKARVTTILKPEHPRVQDLTKQIIEARRALSDEIGNMVRVVQSNYAAARAKEEALEAEARGLQQKALNLKELTVEYTVLNEEVLIRRSLYENVLKRLSQTTISNDLAVSNMQVVQKADKPNGPSSPNIPLNLLFIVAMGLALGVGTAFAAEYMDSKVATPSRVADVVGVSTLGFVPDFASHDRRFWRIGLRARELRLRPSASPAIRRNSELIIFHHPLSILAESYHAIRASLMFSQAEKPPQVIHLTSPASGDGKTVTTLNLGIALAQHGHQVLVIDADLRRGSCHFRLGVSNYTGLSNVLTGQVSLAETVQTTSISRLSFVSCGTRPPNPSALLGSAKMKEILTVARESFDFVLLDSPPTVPVIDAAMLSVLCDGVLLVLNGKKTTSAAAREAMARLNSIRAPVLGVVLNRVDLRDPDYMQYRYYYGSSNSSEWRPEMRSESVIETSDHDPLDESRINSKTHRSVESKTDVLAEAIYDNRRFGLKEVSSEVVPKDFFDYVTCNLLEVAGPMAPVIVSDCIERFGYFKETFPKIRIKELIEVVSNEIPNETLRSNFKAKMLQTWYANDVEPYQR
jgi:capsular exopolysaccharide synthesis family protein